MYVQPHPYISVLFLLYLLSTYILPVFSTIWYTNIVFVFSVVYFCHLGWCQLLLLYSQSGLFVVLLMRNRDCFCVSVLWLIMPFLRSVYKIAIQDYWQMGIALGLFCRLFMSIMIIFGCVFNGHSGLFLLLSTFWSTIIVFIVSTLGRIRLILVCNRVIYFAVY